MSAQGRVARGVSVQLVGRVFSLAVSLATLSFTTRYLQAEGYGLLTAAILFTGLFASFTDFGVGTIIVRRVGSGRGDLENLVGLNLAASTLYAAPLFAVTVISGLLVYPGNSELHLGIAILALGLSAQVVSSCYRPPYDLAIEYGPLTLAGATSRVVALFLTVLTVRFDWGLTAVYWVQVVPNLIELVLLVAFSGRYGRFRPVFQGAAALSLIKEALPIATVGLIAVLYYRADGVILSILSDSAQVGAYGLGYRVVGNLSLISTVFATAVLSTMVRNFHRGPDAFGRTVRRSLETMLIVAVPIATLGVLCTAPVLDVLAHGELADLALAPTQLLMGVTAISFVNLVTSQALITSHKQRSLVVISALALGLNITLNLVLIPRHGAVGSGISLVLTEALSLWVSQVLLYRTSGVGLPVLYIVRLLPAVALGALGWLALRHNGVVVVLAVTAAGYALGLLMFGPVTLEELRAIIARKGEPVELAQPE